MKEERRSVRVGILLTPTEHAVLQQMARAQGRSKSNIMCRALVEAAKDAGMWVKEKAASDV